MKVATRAEVFGWAMYDFANSSYTTVIVTVYFGIVFSQVIVGDAPDYRLGNLLWSVALSTSYGLSVLTLPVLGALMDHVGHRKRFLLASTLVTVVATAALGFTGPGTVALAVALVVVSNYGFSIGESFVASFLPDLGSAEQLGKISGMAWGLGYLGGLGSTAVVLFGLGPPDADNPLVRWAGPATALWFALASVPTFVLLSDRARPKPLPEGSTVVRAGLSQVRDTLLGVGRYRDLLVFFASYLCAMAGLSIVVAFAFIYGDQVIGWSAGTQAAMFALTQLTASFGALSFGWLQGRLGDKPTYALTLLLWCGAVALIWGTPTLAASVRALTGAGIDDEHVFLGVGSAAGLCIGATQSAGRTLVALLAPPGRVGEFFGLWGVAGKLAAIVGLLSLGLLQAALGLENAILVTGAFFAAGFVVVLFVDMPRGRAAAGHSP